MESVVEYYSSALYQLIYSSSYQRTSDSQATIVTSRFGGVGIEIVVRVEALSSDKDTLYDLWKGVIGVLLTVCISSEGYSSVWYHVENVFCYCSFDSEISSLDDDG